MRFRFPTFLLRSLVCFGVLLLLAACPSKGPKSNGEGIMGLAEADQNNARVSCQLKPLQNLEYQVGCFVAVFLDTKEVPATSFKEGHTGRWRTSQVSGPDVEILRCTESPTHLEESCLVKLRNNAQVELERALDITKTDTNTTVTKKALNTLPFWVSTLGKVPQYLEYAVDPTTGTSGIKALSLPREKFPMSVVSGQVEGDDIFLQSFAGPIYRYRQGVLTTYSARLPSSAAQTENFVEPNSHRLRLAATTDSVLVGRSKDGMLFLKYGPVIQTLWELKESGTKEILGEFPTPALGQRDELKGVRKSSQGVYLYTSSWVKKVQAGILLPVAGTEGNLYFGEGPQAKSLKLDLFSLEVYPDGAILFGDRRAQRFLRVEADRSTYTEVFSLSTLPEGNRCWRDYTTTILPSGVAYLLAKACDTSFLYRIDGKIRGTPFTSKVAANVVNCSLYPKVGSRVPVEQFPWFTELLNLLAGHAAGPVMSSYCGVFHYRVSEGVVETLLNTSFVMPNGLEGQKASEAILQSAQDIRFFPNGDIAMLSGVGGNGTVHLHRLHRQTDKITSSQLMLNGVLHYGTRGKLFISDTGKLYTYLDVDNAFFRLEPTGELTLLFRFPMAFNLPVIALRSDTIAYAAYNGRLFQIDLVAGTATELLPLTFYPNGIALHPNGTELYISGGPHIYKVTPLSTQGTFTMIAGQGTAPPVNGALGSQIQLQPASKKLLAVDTAGVVHFTEDDAINRLVPETVNGIPEYRFSRQFPSRASSDCGASLSQTLYSDTRDRIDALLNSVCPGLNESFDIYEEANSTVVGAFRSFAPFGNLLLLSAPKNQ